MLHAVKGIVQGNSVIIKNEDLKDYNGCDVIVTFLKESNTNYTSTPNWDDFVIPSERGKNVELYMSQMRANDRI